MSEPLAVPPAPGGVQPVHNARPTNSLALVSLVAGIACYVVVPLLGAIVAVVTGHLARSQIRRTGEGGSGLALAGLILAYAHLALLLIVGAVLLLLIVLVAHANFTM